MRLVKYISIIFLLFIVQCVFSQDCSRIDTVNLFEMTKLKHELKRGDILSKVVDTIESNTIYNEFAWRIIEYIDSVNQQTHYQLLLDQSYFCYVYSIREGNIFAIELSRYDSVFIEGKYTDGIDTLDRLMHEFVTNPEDKPNLPQKRFKYITYFDTLLITNHGFYINAVMVPDSNGVCSSWDKLNSLINKILNCYSVLRNELAIEKWGVSFVKLDFNRKVAILEYYPINIWIFPNRERMKPPPPPPYEKTEEYIIDSITKIYCDEFSERIRKDE